jgi:sugar/nucleoside kinase (ribokinase family)
MIGVGSPIVDLLARVDDEFLESVHGGKGGMQLVGTDELNELVEAVPGPIRRAPGGSSANTIFALSRLGCEGAFVGKVGDDPDGEYYTGFFDDLGGDSSRFKRCVKGPTGRCLSLVTPDAQRTMRTDLGAASTLVPGEIAAADFEGFQHAHVEGYLLLNPALCQTVLQSASAAGCTISLDLGSYEVVNAVREELPEILDRYVDVVMANEDEARAFHPGDDPAAALYELKRHCAAAAVKLGADGALVLENSRVHAIPAAAAECVLDTTGAGDFWAAGFLYGFAHGWPAATCGRIGAVLGGAAVQHLGAALPEQAWRIIQREIIDLVKGEDNL